MIDKDFAMPNIQAQICDIGRRIYASGFVAANDGNISVRISDRELLLTATGARLGFLTEGDIVMTDYDGKLLEGGRDATSEKILHLEIYRERNDVNAVIHAHAPYSVALSMLDIDIENNLYATVAPIPITEFAMPSSKESYLNMKPYIKEYNWGILRRHGVVAYEKDLLGAFLRLEGMEHLAKMLIYAVSAGDVKPLSVEIKEKLLKFWDITK